MNSYVHICPGCSDRYRDAQTFLWHTETCDDCPADEPLTGPAAEGGA
jgi:hypothetical protein